MAEQVRANEPGNKLYTLCKEGEGAYTMMELYDDAAAIEAQVNAVIRQNAASKTAEMTPDAAIEAGALALDEAAVVAGHGDFEQGHVASPAGGLLVHAHVRELGVGEGGPGNHQVRGLLEPEEQGVL